MADANMLQLPVAPSVDGSEYAWIVQGGADKRTTLQSIADLAVPGLVPITRSIFTNADSGLAGGGSLATDLSLSLDVDNLSAKTTPTIADAIAMNNAVDNTSVKVTPPNFYKTISGLTVKAVPAATDQVVIYSIVDADSRAVAVANLGIPVGNVPMGGTTGQPLVKSSNADFDIAWQTLPVIGGGTGQITLTDHAVLLGQGTSAVSGVTMTGGQLLIGQTGADPSALTVTGDVTIDSAGVTAIGANKVTNAMLRQSSGLSVIGRSAATTGDVADITGTADQVLRVAGAGASLGFGAIDLSKSSAVGSSILGATNGGTGLSSYALGDILYASAADTLSALAGNTTATIKYLSQTGSGSASAAPSWQSISGGDITGAALTTGNDTNVTLTAAGNDATALLRAASITAGWTGTLAVGRGGTGLSSGTSGGVLGFTAAGTLASSVALAANQLVLGGGAGATPVPLGSLGTTTTVLHGNAAGAPTFGAVSLTTDVTGTLPVGNGGTGDASFTAYSVICGGTTSTAALQNVSGLGTSGQVLTSNGAGSLPTWQSGGTGTVTSVAAGAGMSFSTITTTGSVAQSTNSLTRDLIFVIDGGGVALTTGLKVWFEVDYNCTITQATLLADQSGSVVVDVFKCTYADYAPPTHPASGDKITGSAPPTITTATKSQDSTLTGWTTSISAGDVLAANVNSATTITRVTLILKVALP